MTEYLHSVFYNKLVISALYKHVIGNLGEDAVGVHVISFMPTSSSYAFGRTKDVSFFDKRLVFGDFRLQNHY